MGNKMAYKAHRDGVSARFPEPAGQQSLAVDLALLDHSDQLLRDVELSILTTATQHHANTLDRLRTRPGSGESLSLVLLDASHDLQPFPRVQDVVSYGRLGKCAKGSAGKRYGPAGSKIGNADRNWAFAEAAVRF
jgi:Transposase IS116/IS110/IS902 family